MPDPIEAVRANRAELLEIVGDLFFDRTVPTRKSAAARARSGFSVPRGLIAGTLATTKPRKKVLAWISRNSAPAARR